MKPEGWGQKHCIYRGTNLRITLDFSGTMQTRTKWSGIFSVESNSKNSIEFCIHWNYPLKVNIKIKDPLRQITLREFVASRPALEEMLRELL